MLTKTFRSLIFRHFLYGFIQVHSLIFWGKTLIGDPSDKQAFLSFQFEAWGLAIDL